MNFLSSKLNSFPKLSPINCLYHLPNPSNCFTKKIDLIQYNYVLRNYDKYSKQKD